VTQGSFTQDHDGPRDNLRVNDGVSDWKSSSNRVTPLRTARWWREP
jgi:hypothetical protein